MTVPVSSAMTAGDGSSTADGTDAAGGDGISLEINDGSESSTFSVLGGQEVMIVGLVCGCIVVGAVLVVLVTTLLVRKRCKLSKRDLGDDWMDLEEENRAYTRSAPNTRTSTPVSKRKAQEERTKEILRSVSAEMLPEMTKQELVQPRGKDDPRFSENADRYKTNRLDALQSSFDMPDSCDEESIGSQSPPSTPSCVSRLYYTLFYDVTTKELCVTLVKAKGLKGRPTSRAPRDPFVRIYLMPNEKTIQQSRVHKQTNDPIFNETFKFELPPDDIASHTLRMSIYDVDKKRLRHCLGHVSLPLNEADLSDNEIRWGDLEAQPQSGAQLGEIGVTLEYSPFDEQFWVAVMDLKDLKVAENRKNADVYVRVTLMQGGRQVVLCKRTSGQNVQAPSLTFNESLDFTINLKQLEAYSVVVSVIFRSQTLKGSYQEEEYGRITVGSYLFARGNTLLHWQDAVNHPRTPITMIHPLVEPPKIDIDPLTPSDSGEE